jgi:hypothetical protein
MSRAKSLGPFLGAHTALDSALIGPLEASDCLNVRIEDGSLNVAYGFRNIVAAQASFSAAYGLSYLRGYSGSTEVEEYVSYENLGVAVRPYSRNVTTGVATEIKNGSTSQTLNASDWLAVAFNGDSYHINPNDTIARHVIGTSTSWVSLNVPTAPTLAPTYVVQYGGGQTAYSLLSFASTNMSDSVGSNLAVYTGSARTTNSVVNSDGSVSIDHANSTLDSSFTLDLNGSSGGVRDYTSNDIFAFNLSCKVTGFDIDPTTVRFEFLNNDGSPLTLVAKVEYDPNVLQQGGTGAGKTYGFRAEFEDKTRTDFDNIRKVRVSYKVKFATTSGNLLTMTKPFIGGVYMAAPVDRTPAQGLSFGYSYHYSTPDLESGISPLNLVPNTVLEGYKPFPSLKGLGVHIRLTATVSADSNVDNLRFYVQDQDGGFRRLVTQADSTLYFDHKISWVAVLRLTSYTANPYTFSGILNGFAYKGCMCWLYKGGYQNVRYSRIGEPEKQANPLTDVEDDFNRGATFSLADNFGDEPLGGVQAGDAAIIAGKQGVYAQVGNRPYEMTPAKKVPGSFGCAGKFALARWKDDAGNPGMVYLSKDGQVYFVLVSPQFSGDEGSQILCLSEKIFTGSLSVKTFLMGATYTDLLNARVVVDDAEDCLWVILGARGLKFTRPSTIDGKRHWVGREWTLGSTVTWAYFAPSAKWRVRGLRSNGKFDELEFNNSTGVYITGTLRDGGSAIASIYWTSREFQTPKNHTRIMDMDLERDTLTDTPTITITSTRQAQGYTATSGRRHLRPSFKQSGKEHTFKIALTEGSGPFTALEWTESQIGRRVLS